LAAFQSHKNLVRYMKHIPGKAALGCGLEHGRLHSNPISQCSPIIILSTGHRKKIKNSHRSSLARSYGGPKERNHRQYNQFTINSPKVKLTRRRAIQTTPWKIPLHTEGIIRQDEQLAQSSQPHHNHIPSIITQYHPDPLFLSNVKTQSSILSSASWAIAQTIYVGNVMDREADTNSIECTSYNVLEAANTNCTW
jgi:hypothetical protein